jgi:hypothetical protein
MKEAASAMVEVLEVVARDQARYYADTEAGLHADRSHVLVSFSSGGPSVAHCGGGSVQQMSTIITHI